MDQLFTYLFLFLLFCIPLYLVFFLFRRKSASITIEAKIPPGSTGWPIIGETLEYGTANRRGRPEQFVNDRMLKFSSNVFRTSLLGVNFAVFCGAPGNRFLFSSENKYLTTWWPKSIEKIFLFPEEDMHLLSHKEETNTIKSFLPEFLKPEGLQHFIPIMDSMAKEHLEAYWSDERKEVKVFPLSKKYTFELACRLFVSIKEPEYVARLSEFFNIVTTGLLSLPIDFPGTAFHRAVKAANILRHELLQIVKRRKQHLLEDKEQPAADDILTSMLIASAKSGSGGWINEVRIVRSILGLLIASYDTTSALITAVMNFLAEHPQVYENVLKEQMEIAKAKAPGGLLNRDDIQKMKYSWCVARETMRLVPPSPGAYGEAIADFTFSGYTIPKGWKTFWDTHSTHKNPEYFTDPEKFDPSRFEGTGPAPNTYVPFGGGPRKCPGSEYARMEILVFMHNVVTRFKWEKKIPNEKFIYNPFPVAPNGLPIHLESRHDHLAAQD